MLKFSEINNDYLEQLVEFLYSVKWMFCFLNTQYITADTDNDIITENRKFIEALSFLDLNNFPELKSLENKHDGELQKLIKNVNEFKIEFDTVLTDNWKSTPVKKISVKKQYEIENVSVVINRVLQGEHNNCSVVDFGCGLGYIGLHLFEKFGYKSLGLEGCEDRVEKAKERQQKYHSSSTGAVKFVQHFITENSEEFILSQVNDDASSLAIFGLHGCGDLTVTAMKLFLHMSRVTKLIFMPCCYHKMSLKSKDRADGFNLFPLSNELKNILQKYPTFLNRPFLRLAGQQSPAKWKDMTSAEHWIHGKNMFERALVEALISEDETTKRINNISFPENRVTYEDIKFKYQLLEKSSGTSKEWTNRHRQRFDELREKFYDGEEMSENLFCLQTTIQRVCENLVLIDRIRFIEEEGKRLNLKLKISVNKLQNDKLSPRCLILIVEKI